MASATTRSVWTAAQFERLERLRGWTREAIERLDLRPDERPRMKGRVVFAVRDGGGSLIGATSYEPDPERRGRAPTRTRLRLRSLYADRTPALPAQPRTRCRGRGEERRTRTCHPARSPTLVRVARGSTRSRSSPSGEDDRTLARRVDAPLRERLRKATARRSESAHVGTRIRRVSGPRNERKRGRSALTFAGSADTALTFPP